MFGWIFGPGALFWSGSGPSGTWISADPNTPRAYRDDKSLASCVRVKGFRQARQTATRLSRIQANAGLRVVRERSWRLLCPPVPPFSPRDCEVACHRVMESEGVEWLGVGSIRYRYFDVFAFGQDCNTESCQLERHRNRKLEPDTSPLWPQNSVAGDFLPPAVVVALFPSPNPAWAESHRRGFVAHSSLAVSRLNQCCGIVGIGWRVMVGGGIGAGNLEEEGKATNDVAPINPEPSPSLLGP